MPTSRASESRCYSVSFFASNFHNIRVIVLVNRWIFFRVVFRDFVTPAFVSKRGH